MSKKDSSNKVALTYVEERLQNLHSLKDAHLLQTKASDWEKKANAKEVNDPLTNEYRTQISLAVKMQKDAELLSAVPEWNFIPLDGDARKNRKIIKPTWDFHWMMSESDKHISNVIQSATTHGTGILEEWIRHIYKKVKVPYYKEMETEEWTIVKTIEYEEKEMLDKSGIFCERIPFANFFINGTDIDNSTEACVVAFYDKEAYLAEKELDPLYSNLEQVWENDKSHHIISWAVWDEYDETTDNNTVFEIRYYNSAKDEFRVVANWVEIRNTPIPYTHKKLPFALYIDNKADNRIWGIGEMELLEQEERLKNEVRTMLIRGVKFSIGFVKVDRRADVEIDTLNVWLWETLETDDMKAIEQMTFNVPINDISNLETKIDNDIIAKSGVDFKSQLLNPSETATRTENKTKSSKKRINKNIKDNSYNFYRRLAELRMSNIQFLHEAENIEVPIEGWSIDNKWLFIKEESGGYGKAIIWSEMTRGKFIILPITETMLWNNKQRKRDNVIQYSQLVWGITWDDAKPVIKWPQIAKLLTEEFGYDFEKLTEASGTFKSPKDILSEFKKQNQWTKWTMQDENFIPPSQRGRDKQVQTLSGISALPNIEE